MTARITGAFKVEEVPGKSRSGRQCVRLLEPLEYRVGSADSNEVIVVPAGFETDFASIPFGARNLFPPLGPWARPAIVHDRLYDEGGRHCGRRFLEGGTVQIVSYTRAQADAIFREAMEVVGVPAWRRVIMYRAVRLGGWGGWND